MHDYTIKVSKVMRQYPEKLWFWLFLCSNLKRKLEKKSFLKASKQRNGNKSPFNFNIFTNLRPKIKELRGEPLLFLSLTIVLIEKTLPWNDWTEVLAVFVGHLRGL